MVSATKAGLTKKLSRLDELPFESEQQYMVTLHPGEEKNMIYMKGSPERVLKLCQNQLIDGSVKPLAAAQILEKSDELAKEALTRIGNGL